MRSTITGRAASTPDAKGRRRPLTAALTCAVGLALVAAGCGGGSGSTPGSKLTIVNTSGSSWTCNYNPFNLNANVDTWIIYETLYKINDLDGKETPWLATSYQWSNGNKTLTATLRKGVKWNDGKPFTAKDVAFTFNVLEENPETDEFGLWSSGILSNVEAKGDQVVFTFKRETVTSLRYVLSQVRITPEHIWKSVKNVSKAASKKDVGTGPYRIKSCTAQAVIYKKNPTFWQKGKPKVEEVVYPAFKDNPPANLYLKQGKGDWGGQYIPDIETYWVKGDPEHRKFWYPSLSNVTVNINHTKPMFKDKRVRQAMAFAIDREKVSEKGMYGYQKAASQTGIVDSMAEWRDEAAEQKYGYSYNCDKAAAKLKEAGFTKQGKFFAAPGGKKFQPELINNAGYTDWVSSVRIVGDSMRKCGIDVQVNNLEGQQFDTRRDSGQFELAYDSTNAGQNPYYEMRNYLYGPQAQKIGERATFNRGRWKDPETDKLLEAFDSTRDETKQKEYIKSLQQIMLEEVPLIPVTQNVSWSQTDTSRFTGWPSEDNPYTPPAPYDRGWERVLIELKPVKDGK